MDILDFYTDGAYSSTKQKGGWAFVCPQLKLQVGNGEYNTTNNRMELKAILAVLYYIYKTNLHLNYKITIYSDSMYCVGTLKYNWNISKNYKLWDTVLFLWNKVNCRIEHIKGHNKNIYNEMADNLAVLNSNL